MKVLIVFVVVASCIVNCEHLIIGDAANKKLLHHDVAQYNAIPLIKREKQFFYSNPNQQPINSILVYDRLNSKASASITAGGVGHTYVNLLLESERGKGLDFDIGIYG